MRGHIAKKGNRYYPVVDIGRHPETGKRQQKWHSGHRTKKEAEVALVRLVDQVNQGFYEAPTKQTVAEYFREWIDSTKTRLRPSTWESYRINVVAHIVPHIGPRRLQALTPTTLNSFYATLLQDGSRKDGQKGGLSPRTVRYIHTIIRKALKDAVRWGRLSRNVADLADPPQRVNKEMRTWTVDELRRFLERVRTDRLYPVWLLAATTGMRKGEVLGLRWVDVDLNASRLAVRQTLISIGYRTEFSSPKTARGSRSIALDSQTVAALRSWKVCQAQERLAVGQDWMASGLVFTNEDGSLIHPDRFHNLFERHVREARLPRIRFHDLRHTHASLALQAGIHPKVVSERLGHASIAITMDTYSHAIPALQEDAAERVAALVFGEI